MFLIHSKLSISDTSVQIKRRPLSFFSAREMRVRIENLPSPPRWKEVEVSIEGGTTRDPLTFYYRDGLESFKFLFGNPLFRDHMEYVPRREYTDESKKERLYSEMMTGDLAWSLQVAIFYGHLIVEVKLTSFRPGKN